MIEDIKPYEKTIPTKKGDYIIQKMDEEVRLIFPDPVNSILGKFKDTFYFYEEVTKETFENYETLLKLGDRWVLRWIVNGQVQFYITLIENKLNIDSKALKIFLEA